MHLEVLQAMLPAQGFGSRVIGLGFEKGYRVRVYWGLGLGFSRVRVKDY